MSFRERWPGSRITKWIFGVLAAVVAYVALIAVLSPVMFPVFDYIDWEYWRKEEIEESRRLIEKWQREDLAAEKEDVPPEAPPAQSEKKVVKKTPQAATPPKAKKNLVVSSPTKIAQRPAPLPQPKAEEPKEGMLPSSAIETEVGRHGQEIYVCYYRARTWVGNTYEQEHEAAGKVKVRFIIEINGGVKTAEVVQDDVGLPRLPECLVETFRLLRFPAPTGGGTVTVRYPFIFAEPWMRKYPELAKQAAP